MRKEDLSYLQRGEGEDYKGYKIRLIVAKLNGDIEISWNELRKILDIKHSPDHLRKVSYGIKESYDYLMEVYFKDNVKDKGMLEIIKKEIDKLEKVKEETAIEKMKLQSLRISPRKEMREKSREELFAEMLIDSIKYNDFRVERIVTKSTIINNEKHLFLPIADIHYGKIVELKDLQGNYMNRYNTEEFEKRMWELLDEVEYIIHKEDITNMTIVNLSDSIDGILRASQIMSLEKGMTKSVIDFSKFMIKWLSELAKIEKLVDIQYYSTLGNHNEIRPLGSKNGDFAHENTEYFISQMLDLGLSNVDKITINETLNHVLLNILDYNILCTHGQKEKKLENSVKDYNMLFNTSIDMLVTGHLHSKHQEVIGATEKGNIEYLQVPSVCGTDDYALSIKKNAKAGVQAIVLETNKNRKTSYDIILN